MLASEVVDNIVEVGGGYYTRAKVLNRVNTEQNRILANCALMLRSIEVPTTAGVLTYDLPQIGLVTARSLFSVSFSEPDPLCTSRNANSKASVVGSDGTVLRWAVNGVTFVSGDQVNTASTGSITFAKDPEGRIAFVDCFVWPNALLDETDDITLPDQFCSLIEIGVLGALYNRQYGNADNLAKQGKQIQANWSVFLAGLNSNTARRPGWGYRTSQTYGAN